MRPLIHVIINSWEKRRLLPCTAFAHVSKEALMFNRRQLEILLELCENPNSYITASYFAKKQQVSLRTIQSDIKAMKNELVEWLKSHTNKKP